MAGARSERHRQERDARDTYNSRKRAPVSDRDVKKDKILADQFGGDNHVNEEDPRKTKKMKAMWVILLLIVAGGCFYAAYKYCQNKASEAIADEAPRIERTVTTATPAVKATPTKPEPKEVKVEEVIEVDEPKPQPRKSEYEDQFWSHLSDPRWTGSKDPASMSVEEVCEYTNFVADYFGY